MAQQMLSMMNLSKQHATPQVINSQKVKNVNQLLQPEPAQGVNKRKKKKRRRRTSYSLSQKLAAVDEAEKLGIRMAASNCNVDERVLRQWLYKADRLKEAVRNNPGDARRLRARVNDSCNQCPENILTDEEEDCKDEEVVLSQMCD